MSINLATSDDQSDKAGRLAWWKRAVRPKGHLSSRTVWILAVVACVPLPMALARILALPGIHIPGLTPLGAVLNRSLSLEWVPPADRWVILYILLLPVAALLVALARLTFGLRVLGFRSILIAVGFHEIGILPSLLLMGLMVAAILATRPPMRRMQLPFYSRIAVILCIATLIMVSGLLLGPALRSDTLWSFAFFPVIILAMLAEGIAGTLARDDAWTAAWRAGSTIVVALVIAFVTWIPAVRQVALHFPELIVTQLIAIIFISEFLDLRLFEQLPARMLQRMRASSGSRQRAGPSKVAVVQNRSNTSVIGRLGVGASSKERTQSVQSVVDALRDQGFTVKSFEGDMSLLRELHEFLRTDLLSGAPGGLVLNLAAGVQGRGRSCHLPAMLEMAGVPYSGPDPIVLARLLDRYGLMMLLRRAGVRTPRVRLMPSVSDVASELHFPLIVRPRYELEEGRTIVKDRRALDSAVRHIVGTYAQEALAEEWERAPEIRASLLGNDTVECLPLLEMDALGNRKACPAEIPEPVADRIRECARTAYAAVGCRDYGRVDIRLTASGEPQVCGVHAIGIFARKGSFAQSAEKAGYSFGELMRRVVDLAWSRYGAAPPLQVQAITVAKPAVPLLNERSAAK